jgi:DNA-binding FadR family transcriptional regulator
LESIVMKKKRNEVQAPPARRGLVANKITDLLREENLSHEDGHFLGSEEELLERFNVSRPTFRQTARMLEQEQILVVRRGLGGGYHTRTPCIETVARSAATYLRSRHTTERQLVEASKAAGMVLAEQAARADDEEARRELAACLEAMRSAEAEQEDGFVEFHTLEMRFGAAIARLADNPALELFIATLYRVALQEAQKVLLRDRPDRRRDWRRLRIRLAEALLAGEVEVSVALSVRAVDTVLGWLDENSRTGLGPTFLLQPPEPAID